MLKQRSKMAWMAVCGLASMGLWGCLSREAGDMPGTAGPVDQVPEMAQEARVREYIESRGYPADKIVSEDEFFIVDGCLSFRKDMELPASIPSAPLAKRSQYHGIANRVSPLFSRNILVKLESSIEGEAGNLQEALKVLNQTYSDLHFSMTTGDSWHIFIYNHNTGSSPPNWTATANAPTTDIPVRPGTYIRLNTWPVPGAYISMNNTVRRMVLIHELLHTVGMDHVDFVDANGNRIAPTSEYIQVPLTPGWKFPDPFSIMHRGVDAFREQIGVANSISYYDHLSIQYRYPNTRTQRGADVNGDRKTDLVLVNTAGAVSYKLSTGGALTGAPVSAGTFGDVDGQYFSGDINGDLRSDLLFAKNGVITMRRSTGSGFESVRTLTSSFGSTGTGGIYHTLDFNGDGRQDVLYYDLPSMTVNIRLANSTGTGLGSTVYSRSFGDPAGQIFVGDFNGDNKDDIFCANRPTQTEANPAVLLPHTVDVLLSAGTSFQNPMQVVCGDCFGHISWDGQYFAADFNNDNKDDIFFKSHDSRVYVWLSTGSGMGAVIGPSGIMGWTNSVVHASDINGDGKVDVFSASPGGEANFLRSNGTSMGTVYRHFLSGFGNLLNGDIYL